ncbi:neutral/alkaline ceramidase-like enzyme [Pontibacter ummariensis]|uniref:Neutral ceramidase n=1 Tax=Pontibacter ummariensis TaxID=1610492 RepID=A0A239JRM7_9BACT|nr:neutral/alkaline non-lysosomal ceramidase N-terminal domain-containing protein [Pontibacter ummariensis]PRY07381.1 neutral/alkaline ceramidase-like enzyme [Pontibacter ummariensis]SNT08078.1 Neutral/alkaline non-lysosomal ceramidase, N-terminal [Pontibacter ummariensis]
MDTKEEKSTRRSRYQYVLLFLLLLTACVVRPLDRTPYQETEYYEETIEELEEHPATVSQGDTLQVGWAKVNVTPPTGTPLAGYGKRLGMAYEEVHDSAWVRTFAFSNGKTEAYYVALDLLIVPMEVLQNLEEAYPALGLKPEQVYLSATHSHTSFGGWGKKLGVKVMSGKYDEELVERLTRQIVQSMQLARQHMKPTKVGYGSTSAASLVRNRLLKDPENPFHQDHLTNRDTQLRFLKFERPDGTLAVLSFFAAHPTILPSAAPELSRDYPGVLVDALEERISFAAFSAGAVGSHSPVYFDGDTYESTVEVGGQLAELLREQLINVSTAYVRTLGYGRVHLELPDPHWRISRGIRLAPFLFNSLFGEHPAYATSLQLGNIVLLGAPADYSGEFVPHLEQQAQDQGQQAIVTSFNGGYIGYITPDKYYNLDGYETRSMNFFGPYSGSYLTEMLCRLLQQHQVSSFKN